MADHDHDHENDPHGSAHFDERAATWDEDPGHVERAEAIAAAVASEVPLDPSTRVFEYGAGTGLVSQLLRPRVGPITVADTSEGMREVLRAKAHGGSLDGARVWEVDLATTAPPPGEVFDLAVTVMTLHHIEDLAPVLDAFAALLAPGGHLCVADLEEEDGSFHSEGFHGHHGFARPDLTAALEAAGFDTPTFTTPYRITRDDRTYPVFLAVSRRPA